MEKIFTTLLITISLCLPVFVSAQEVQPIEDTEVVIPIYFFADEDGSIFGIIPIFEDLFLWFYPHALTTVSTTSSTTAHIYDNNGNLTSDETWTNTWDYNNKLLQSVNSIEGNTTTYNYDQSGQRVYKNENGVVSIYPNRYYTIEDGVVKKHIFAGDLNVASVEGATTTYHHTDHLSGSSVESDHEGYIVEVLDYYPFGEIRLDEKYTNYENDRKFTGYELDNTDLYYAGQRYYNSDVGRFVSEDKAYLNLGVDERANKLLQNPQLQNSYSYSGNNPIVYVDPTGESRISAWLHNPILTAVQSLGWWAGSTLLENTNLTGSERPISSALMKHSLSVNPRDVRIDQGNQSRYGNVIDAIRESGEYSNLVSGLMESNADSGTINYGPGSEGYHPLEFGSSSGDLFSAIHGTTGTKIQGTKGEGGDWNLSVNITDTYDYKLQASGKEYRSSPLFNSLNNSAYFSQKAGTISNYDIGIRFEDKVKGGDTR